MRTYTSILTSVGTGGYLSYLTAFTIIGAIPLVLPSGIITLGLLGGLAVLAIGVIVIAAVAIEATVSYRNIAEAAKNLDPETSLLLARVEDNLNHKRRKNYNTLTKKEKDYFLMKDHLHELSENLSCYSSADRIAAEKRIARIRSHLRRMLMQDVDQMPPQQKTELRNELKVSTRLTYCSMASSVLASIFFGVTAGFALASPLGLICAIPLAIGGGIGQGLMMYGNVSKIIKRGKVGKWLQKLDAVEGNCAGIKKAGISFILGCLVIFSAIAAIYSYASPVIDKFATLSVNVVIKAAQILFWTLAGIAFVLTLLFDFDNSLESIKKIKNSLKEASNDFAKARAQETWSQFLNPFRHCKTIIMLGHSYCTGISTDGFPTFTLFGKTIQIKNWIVALITGITELLNDWHYGTEHDNHLHKTPTTSSNETTNNHHHDGAPHDDIHAHCNGHSHGHGTHVHSHNHPPAQDDEDDHDDDHDHGSALDCLIRLFTGAAVRWDYYGGKKDYTWDQATAKISPEKTLPAAPIIAEESAAVLLKRELSDLETQYKNGGETAKADGFASLAKTNESNDAINNARQTLRNAIDPRSNSVFLQHRYLGIFSQPASAVAIKDIINDDILMPHLGGGG